EGVAAGAGRGSAAFFTKPQGGGALIRRERISSIDRRRGAAGVSSRMSKKEITEIIQSLCVLVVDDNQYMRKIVRNLLVNCGVKDIYEAGDGITALDTLRTVGP